MWPIRSTVPELALALLFCSSSLGATKAPYEYRFETLAGGACTQVAEPTRVEVSLTELERLARDRQKNARSTSDLTLGSMTTLEAIHWDRARQEIVLEGVAGECEVEPIPLDMFVEALRIAEASSMWMSLEPTRQGREVWHRVELFPPGLANTHLLASMTKADYFLKALLLRAVDTPFDELPSVQRIFDCRVPEQIEPEVYRHESRNVFIFGLPPALTLSADGKTVHLKPPRLILRYGSSPSLLTREYARAFNQSYPRIEKAHPRVFRGIRNAFMLFHVADLLRQWARDYDFSYWLARYPLQAYKVPDALPAPIPRKVARFCGSSAEGVYALEKTLAGGAVTEEQLHWDVPDTGPGVAGVFSDGERVLVLERSGKASLVTGDHQRSGSYSRSSGTVRVAMGDEILDLRLADGGTLEDPAGARWIPWLSLEDAPQVPQATAAPTEGSVPPQNRDHEPGPIPSSAKASPPLPDPPLSDSSLGLPRWVPTPFHDVSQVRAVEPGATKATQPSDQARLPAGAGSQDPASLEQSGSYYQSTGNYALALERYESCLHRLETTGKRKDPQYLRCLTRTASLHSETYDFKRAEAFFRSAQAAASGLADADALDLYSEALGWHYVRRGSFAPALEIFQSRLERLQTSQPQNPIAVSEALRAVARCRFELLGVDEARPLLLMGIQRLEDAKLMHHPTYSWLLNDLAVMEMTAKSPKDLAPQLQSAFDLARQYYGVDNPGTLAIMSNLALAYGRAGKLRQAARLIDQASDLLERGGWEDFFLQERLVRNRAFFAFLLGHEELARSEMERAVIIARHALGERHPDTIQAVAELAEIEGLMGHRARANELWTQSVSLRDSSSDPAFATLRLRLQALRILSRAVQTK